MAPYFWLLLNNGADLLVIMIHKQSLKIISILIILLLVFFSGCTGQLSPDNGYGSSDKSYDGRYGANPSTGTGQPADSYGNAYTNITDRKVINTAIIKLETGEFDQAVNSIRSIAANSGGYVESASLYAPDDGRKTMTITIKVPQSSFEQNLAQIRALGKVRYDQTSGQDVPRQYIDLNARLKNLKIEEQKLTEIMNRAATVQDILDVEKELSRVRYEIEKVSAELNYLSSRVDFATITAEVSEPQPVMGYDWGFDEAIREAARGFVAMIGVLIVATGYFIPLALYFLIIAAVLYFIVKIVWGIYRKRTGKK